jgi:transposase
MSMSEAWRDKSANLCHNMGSRTEVSNRRQRMTLHARDWFPVPEDTARVARRVYRKGNVYMTVREELGFWYKDSDYASLFVADRGRPAESPGRLNLVLIVQFAEGLTDRQVAEEVRGRIDLKYLLGLPLDDPGFDFSVLSEYRARLIAGGMEARLLEDMLSHFREQGMLKARGRQRTDSTHVLAAIRHMNRLERVGETLRAALNALATVNPEWLLTQITSDWFDRYGPRFEQYRLPKQKAEQETLAVEIGADGYQLLTAIYDATTPNWLRTVPAVETLRQVWVQQYYLEGERVFWRTGKNSPPSSQTIQSPYEVEARNRTKRDLNWTGYAVHLTETCDPDRPNLITDVQTTPATHSDVTMTAVIHDSLAKKDLLPKEHYVDTGYMDADLLLTSREQHGVDLCGPVLPDTSWQARSGQGFDLSCFAIDWEAKHVTCPEGQVSQSWQLRHNAEGKEIIVARFDLDTCQACAHRTQCTKAKTQGRVLTFRPQAQYTALQMARKRQETLEFKEQYKRRAGIEGTVSQETRSFDLRRSRYIGLAKTHLQHVLVAGAMNLTRAVSWHTDNPRAKTRQSRFAALAYAA